MKVIGGNLRNGSIRSCGCLASEWASFMGSNPEFIAKRAEKMVKHGAKRKNSITVEYKTWLSIKRRCYDPKFKDYPNWGGRGIRVCERWNASFESFLKDMGPRPPGRFSIDRIDPDQHYSPENCHWTPIQKQGAEHSRNLKPITVKGISYSSVAAACRANGVPETRVHYRLSEGFSIDEAFDPKKRSRWT